MLSKMRSRLPDEVVNTHSGTMGEVNDDGPKKSRGTLGSVAAATVTNSMMGDGEYLFLDV